MSGEAIAQPDEKSFRNAMRAFVGNCSILTVGLGEKATGLVVTSGISLSSDPPLVLACINRSSSSWSQFTLGGHFGWSSLGGAHQTVAERFSGFGGVKGHARYEGNEWETTSTGVKLLKGAPTAFECSVEEMIDRATHSIVIGRVRKILSTPDAGALIYWNGQFRAMSTQ